MERETLNTPDGAPLAVFRWTGESPRGLVQIVHGMAEHAARYDRLAQRLVDEGWAVVAHDQRGHGASAEDDQLGHFADEGGWQKVISDVRKVREHAREQVPEGPLVLLGHSMGSFISLYEQTDRPTVDKLVLSGSNKQGGALVSAGLVAAKLERLRQGRHGTSGLLAFLSFGSFNKPFEPARTEFDWLSRDPDEVDKYVADDRCGFRCTNQLWIDLLEALVALGKPGRLARLPNDLPVYLLSGENDPVGEAGKGVRALRDQLSKAGVSDLTMRLYAGARHELFNETNRDEVVTDLVAWLDRDN